MMLHEDTFHERMLHLLRVRASLQLRVRTDLERIAHIETEIRNGTAKDHHDQQERLFARPKQD